VVSLTESSKEARHDSSDPHVIQTLPVLVVHAHSSCNCRCIMCDIWKARSGKSFQASDLEPHVASIRRLGVRWLVFSGGEPLLNQELPLLCSILRKEKIRLTLLTTGLLLEKHADEVVASFDDVIVSLDGPAEIHDAIRRVDGAFALLRAGVNSLRERRKDIRITARTVVQKANHRNLRETMLAARLLLRLDGISFLAADLTSTAFNRPIIWPAARQQEVGLSLTELAGLESEIELLIRESAGESERGFISETPEKLRRIVQHFKAQLGLRKAESPICNAPWVSAVIETDGTVRPCFFHPGIGNLHDQSLDSIVNGKVARDFRAGLDIPSNPICNRCVCSLHYRL
jgi:MoaA/NifB/PqqE/SkfB family radical SAM enzyme